MLKAATRRDLGSLVIMLSAIKSDSQRRAKYSAGGRGVIGRGSRPLQLMRRTW